MARLIGTAGHVDHGKTTLIRALTGIDADRLPEEKKRGMTIDIGFAYIDLPGLGRVSIVDVPGHEKFIHNMLVGALGIGVALICVSADEGVMPQTREHFDILRLLPVDRMVVAMTRCDLADEETREFAKLDIIELLKGSRFEGSPIVPVSAFTGDGLPQLRHALGQALIRDLKGPAAGPWYLPIDRAFAAKGHGTIVTGTLAQGQARVGDNAVLVPGSIPVRVRSLQAHDESIETADSGTRLAINLGGIKLEEVHRGMTVGEKGSCFETRIFDARMEWLSRPKHNQRVRVSIGAAEVMGKAFLSEENPDIVQFRLEAPVAAAIHQPLIVRRYSPMDLMGGGRVVVPVARARRKSDKVAVVEAAGSDADGILHALAEKPEGLPTEEICRLLGKTPQALGKAFEGLGQEGRIRGFAGLWVSAAGFDAAVERIRAVLAKLHAESPTVGAHPRERVMALAKLPWAGKNLDRVLSALSADGLIAVQGNLVRLADFKVQLSDKQTQFLGRVKVCLEEAGLNVPGVDEIARQVPAPIPAVEEILRLGVSAGEIVRVADGLFYSSSQMEAIKEQMRAAFSDKPFAASDFRDRFKTSRKYTIPLLEYFDSNRVTLRQGDHRTLT